jgi:hypothetical protein
VARVMQDTNPHQVAVRLDEPETLDEMIRPLHVEPMTRSSDSYTTGGWAEIGAPGRPGLYRGHLAEVKAPAAPRRSP